MDSKTYECVQCSEKISLKDRPVMTIIKGKPKYYCQNCWANKDKAPKGSTTSTTTTTTKTSSVTTVKNEPAIKPKPQPPKTTTSATEAETSPPPPPPPKAGPVSKTTPSGNDSNDAKLASKASKTLVIDESEGRGQATLKCTSCMNSKTAAQMTDATGKLKTICSDCEKSFVAELLDKTEPKKNNYCFVCEKDLSGSYYTCGEYNYHESCITCHDCGRKDRSKWENCMIYPADDGKGVKFYCSECHLANCPNCFACSKPITDGALTVGSGDTKKNYHVTCLNCGHCGKNMAKGEQLIYLNEILTCSECRKERGLNCKRCKQLISGQYSSVSGDGTGEKNHYHSKCFLCIICNNDLNTRELGGQTQDDRKEIMCKECYIEKHVEKCSRCPKPLIGAFFRLAGEKLCKDCCRCASCGSEIESQFKMKTNGDFQCVDMECPGNKEEDI